MTRNLNAPRGPMERAKEFLVSKAEDAALLPRLLFNLKVEVATIRGKIRGSDQTAVMLYVGRGNNRAYLKGKLLVDAEVVSSEFAMLWSYHDLMKTAEAKADFVFIDIGLPYQYGPIKGGDYLVLPDWINMIVPIEGDWDRVESGFNKTTRKLIRRNPYSYEVSHDPDVIARFYDDYYMPYLTLRHEDAVVEPRKAVERRARQGGVLRVMGDDGPVMAGVVYPEDGILYYLWLGMPEHHLDNPPEGALFASYYFVLRYAFENGFQAANWMGTRAFPTDGVFQFKRKWGTVAEDSFSPDSILFKPVGNNLKTAAFAQTFPLIARRDGKLELLLCTVAETLSDTEIRRMISGYLCDGMDQITIAHITDAAEKQVATRSEAFPNLRIVETNLDGLSTIYASTFENSD